MVSGGPGNFAPYTPSQRGGGASAIGMVRRAWRAWPTSTPPVATAAAAVAPVADGGQPGDPPGLPPARTTGYDGIVPPPYRDIIALARHTAVVVDRHAGCLETDATGYLTVARGRARTCADPPR